MSELLDLFGDWAHHADGTPYVVVVDGVTGDGAWGPVVGDPTTISPCPVMFGNRLVRTATGDDAVASITLYVESQHEAACALGSGVTIDGSRQTTIMRVDPVSHLGMFDYLAVFCE